MHTDTTLTDTPLTDDALLSLLCAFIEQRPGLDPRNYGDWRAYRNESADITRDLRDACQLLAVVEKRPSAWPHLRAELQHGRLTLAGNRLDYCVGQYWPTEYRAAACRVLAGALWAWYRGNGASTGDDIRRAARIDLGATLARRWFH